MTRGLRLIPRHHVSAPVEASPHRLGTQARAPFRATRRVPVRRQQERTRPRTVRPTAELMPLASIRALLQDRQTTRRRRAPSMATPVGETAMAKGRANQVTMIIATAGTTVGTGTMTDSRRVFLALVATLEFRKAAPGRTAQARRR